MSASFIQQLRSLFAPYWNKNTRNKLNLGGLAVALMGLQAAILYSTLPPSDQDEDANSNPEILNLKALLIPMFSNAIQTMLINNMQAKIGGALQEEIIQKLFGNPQDITKKSSKNIGMIHTLGDEELKKNMQMLAQHVDDAAFICEVLGLGLFVVPMTFYWRTAYLSLEERARGVLYAATGITAAVCLMQKKLADCVAENTKKILEKDNNFRVRLGANIRYNEAIIAGDYQNFEENVLNELTNDKQSIRLSNSRILGAAIAINNAMNVALMNLLRFLITMYYPHMRATANLDTFSIAMTFFANNLLQIIYSLSFRMPKSTVALSRIQNIEDFFAQMQELEDAPFLNILYEQNIGAAMIKCEDFSIAIPKRNVGLKNEKIENILSARQKIAQVLSDTNSSFLFYKRDLEFNPSSCLRVLGPSGSGKSTLFKTFVGMWPYASGKISFACKREEIFVMPQEQLLVNATLLENIYYPNPVPIGFTGSTLETELYSIMRIIGLEKQIARLHEKNDWESPDLSPGLKKRINFLRMYANINSNPHGITPKIILLDEANAGVDPESKACMDRLIYMLRKKYPELCVLFIRHEDIPNDVHATQAQIHFKHSDPNFDAGIGDYNEFMIKHEPADYVNEQLDQQSEVETVTTLRHSPTLVFRRILHEGYVDIEQQDDLTLNRNNSKKSTSPVTCSMT